MRLYLLIIIACGLLDPASKHCDSYLISSSEVVKLYRCYLTLSICIIIMCRDTANIQWHINGDYMFSCCASISSGGSGKGV